MPFKVTLDGESMLTEDFSLDELIEIEKQAGEPWSFVIAAPLRSAATAKPLLVAFLARRMPADEAAKRVGVMTFKQTLDAFDLVDDDRPEDYSKDGVPRPDPKAGTAGTGTTSSSGAPNASDGPPT